MQFRDHNGNVVQNEYKISDRGEEDNIEKNVTYTENSQLELLSNLSSSTAIEQNTVRRSKRLTKTNPIIRLNKPVPSDYRKYSQKNERQRSHIRKGR